MQSIHSNIYTILVCFGLLVFPTTSAAEENLTSQRNEAFALMDKGNSLDALPLLESLAKKNPADKLLYQNLARALVAAISLSKDDAAAEVLRIRALAAANRAKELGDDSDILKMMLGVVSQPLAKRDTSPVAEAMREGDAAFSRADYLGARAKYMKALELEPKRYDATIYTGNTYFVLKQFDEAIVWFSRATQIDPNIETAYRWWGDVLSSQGKVIEARDKYIDAFIAEPQAEKPRMGIKRWIRSAEASNIKFRFKFPEINVPVSVKGKNLEVSPNLGKGPEKGQEAWLVYGMTLMTFKEGSALEREVKAFRSVVDVARELGYNKDTPGLDPSLARLLVLESKGLLESHILFVRGTDEVRREYSSYREKNRNKLRQYWTEEVLQLL